MGTLSFDLFLGCARGFFVGPFFLIGLCVRFCPAPSSWILVPVLQRGPLSLLLCRSSEPAPLSATLLPTLWALVSTSHFCCGQILLLVLMPVFPDCAHSRDEVFQFAKCQVVCMTVESRYFENVQSSCAGGCLSYVPPPSVEGAAYLYLEHSCFSGFCCIESETTRKQIESSQKNRRNI